MLTSRGHNGSHQFVDTSAVHRAQFGLTEPRQRTMSDMRQMEFGRPVSYSPAAGTPMRDVPYAAPPVDMDPAGHMEQPRLPSLCIVADPVSDA